MNQLTATLLAIPLLTLACDSPDDEAMLEALDEASELQDKIEVTADNADVSTAPDLNLDLTNVVHPVADYSSAVDQWGVHVPCGLSASYHPNANGSPGIWAQSVGNCHYYSVKRSIVYDSGSNGMCRNYGQHEAFSLVTSRKPIDIVGC